ncbi:MAG: bifunctional diguanylate cyclase/phosphodiesterase [Syntrophomonas sp.]
MKNKPIVLNKYLFIRDIIEKPTNFCRKLAKDKNKLICISNKWEIVNDFKAVVILDLNEACYAELFKEMTPYILKYKKYGGRSPMRKLRQQLAQKAQTQLRLSDNEDKFRTIDRIDLITGLPDRKSLKEKIKHLIGDVNVQKIALLYIDIDNFKYINDILGHSTGDMLIKEIAKRLIPFVSDTFILYRVGGDTFTFIYYDYLENENIEEIADMIQECIRWPCFINQKDFYITVSIGISIYPDNGANSEELIKCASVAMYKAKHAGRNRHVFFDNKMLNEHLDKIRRERYLHSALENHEFVLYYQPQLNVNTGKISGFEALLRWNNPEMGFVLPDNFISIAEETQLIIPIGKWVLYEACQFVKSMHNSGFNELTIAVNISMVQLMQLNFVNSVLDILQSVNLEPEYLELEITESILMESYDSIIKQLDQLREKGIKLAMDDFGKGYSSLAYLKQLPFSTLKIDKSFFNKPLLSENDGDLIELIISMGYRMGFEVVAEGVETLEQINLLIKKKCSRIQGYFVSQPLPEKEATVLINHQ